MPGSMVKTSPGSNLMRAVRHVMHIHAERMSQAVYKEMIHPILAPVRVFRPQRTLTQVLSGEDVQIHIRHAGLEVRGCCRLRVEHELINLSLARGEFPVAGRCA